ncbi:MAG TPA: hypothetical protein DFJ59_01270, partial [Alphaproteobacteria bacterium]|nr:hypothetical protein [Alphaproteobacteria bacterium]
LRSLWQQESDLKALDGDERQAQRSTPQDGTGPDGPGSGLHLVAERGADQGADDVVVILEHPLRV